MKKVKPKYIGGWNMSIAQLWGSGPKLTITCGDCSSTFKQRVPMIDKPGVVCPHCGTVNVLPLYANEG